MRKKIKKSTGLALALFIYVTAMAVYFLPRNTEIGSTEKYINLGASYLIVLALWFFLRKKEKARERREEEQSNKQKMNKNEKISF
jgi:ABC-type nickel/cobalt efflux system permease component RcnA